MKNNKNISNIDATFNERISRKNPETMSLVSTISNRSSSQISKRTTLDIDDHLPDVVNAKNIMLSSHKSISSEMLMHDNRRKIDFDFSSRKKFGESIESIQERNDVGQQPLKSNILENMPYFGLKNELTTEDVSLIKEYLIEAFKDMHHPLGVLLSKISKCFYFSYGHWNNKKPAILTSHALDELESISIRIYNILRYLFPALPEDSIIVDK